MMPFSFADEEYAFDSCKKTLMLQQTVIIGGIY